MRTGAVALYDPVIAEGIHVVSMGADCTLLDKGVSAITNHSD